jgi:hypothetical protein
MVQIYKTCQSCSMPMKKDPAGGGTNADGSKSAKYCSYCYQNGQFKSPNMTVAEMQALVRDKLQEMHFPGFIAGLMAKSIPKLERWKK